MIRHPFFKRYLVLLFLISFLLLAVNLVLVHVLKGHPGLWFIASLAEAVAVSFVGARILSLSAARRVRALEMVLDRLKKISSVEKQDDFRGDPWTILERRLDRMGQDLEKLILALRGDKERIEAILESMFEGVLVIGPDGKVLFVNDVFVKIFRADLNRAFGKNYWEIFMHEKIHRMIEEALKSRQAVGGEASIGLGEGERYYQTQISPVAAKDHFLGAVLILHNVTSLKKLEKMRSEFVANISHELKTPLSSIMGAVETLKLGAIDDLENRGLFLDMIEKHSRDLKKLIEDLLILAKIESSGQKIDKDKFDIAALLKDVYKAILPDASKKNIELILNSNGRSFDLTANRFMAYRALSNLVENAVKYTDEGGKVEISFKNTSHETVITVKDSGIGLSDEDQARIFERFYRTEKSRSRDAGGTGLGLSIVKHIAEAHGGGIFVESRLYEGSAFSLSFPNL